MLSKVLEELRRNHLDYFDTGPTPEFEVRFIRDHPNSRIACVRARRDQEERTLFVKLLYPDRLDERSNRSDRVYKETQIQTEYEVLATLDRALAAEPEVGAVKPVACFPSWLALVTQGQDGVKFSSVMRHAKIYSGRDHHEGLARWSYLAGRWLLLFQDAVRPGGGLAYDFREMIEYCDVRLDILAYYDPGTFSAAFCGELREILGDQIRLAEQASFEVVGRHNDYSTGNIILSGRKLVLLDFSGFSYGPACGDFVKFWSGLDLMKGSPFVTVKTVEALQAAFLTGYGRPIDRQCPLFTIFRLAYVLDKMGDLWRDWPRIAWLRRPAYAHLYGAYLAWVRALSRAAAREHSYA